MWIPPSSAAADRFRIAPVRVPLDMTGAPEYESTTYNRLRQAEYEWNEPRTDYRYVRINRPDSDVTEGGFARARAENNFANLQKFAGRLSDAVETGAAGAALGGLTGHVLADQAVNKRLGRLGFLKGIGPVQNAIKRTTLQGAVIGGVAGIAGGMVKNSSDDPEGHAFITDIGVTTVPKKLGPSDLSHAYHLNNPVAKYYPAMATAILGGGSALYDLAMQQRVSPGRALALSTLGSAIGTLGKLYGEDRYMKPYKKDYVRAVEKKYGQKMASGAPAVNEYITETNIEVLPFHGTAPDDLDTAYHFKHPLSNYAAGLGTLAGSGAYLASSALKGKPVSLAPALISGTIAGAGAAILSQIHKDVTLNKFRQPYTRAVAGKYRGMS